MLLGHLLSQCLTDVNATFARDLEKPVLLPSARHTSQHLHQWHVGQCVGCNHGDEPSTALGHGHPAAYPYIVHGATRGGGAAHGKGHQAAPRDRAAHLRPESHSSALSCRFPCTLYTRSTCRAVDPFPIATRTCRNLAEAHRSRFFGSLATSTVCPASTSQIPLPTTAGDVPTKIPTCVGVGSHAARTTAAKSLVCCHNTMLASHTAISSA